MKRKMIVLMALALCQYSLAQHIRSFYVSPTGADTGSGTMEQPLASVESALRQIAEQGAKWDRDSVIIHLREGIYYSSTPIEISQKTLGGSKATLTIKAYEGENVLFHGGKKLNGANFKKVRSRPILNRLPEKSRDKVWEINLKRAGITDYPKLKQHGFGTPPSPTGLELFINGKPQLLARYPNAGKLSIGKIYDTGSIPRDGDFSNRGGEFGFGYERAERWKKADDIWLHGKFSRGYNDDHLAVERINYEKKSIKIKQPHIYGLYTSTLAYIDSTKRKDLAGLSVRGYYAYNLLEEIDRPGEYYLDRNRGVLYVYPESPLEKATIGVSLSPYHFFEIKDRSHVHLKDLKFTAARGMAVYLENSRDITIDGCEFSNLGTVAISMGRPLMEATVYPQISGNFVI